jgi:hypothetical protein
MAEQPQPDHHNYRVRDHVFVRRGTHIGCCGTIVKVHEVMISLSVHNPTPYVVCIHPTSVTRSAPFVHPRHIMNHWNVPTHNQPFGGIHFLTATMQEQVDSLIMQLHIDGINDKVDTVLRHIQERIQANE